ncbi:3-methyladenine DNA glycosylase (macronuclear) [Tetrahymena thermophila SB210]|uniref:DNA-3-methyladenine glycosylase II n=1 Tax=Tetrahymena thermophila (strain SB210) TaxID=312017 RepID=Q24CD4_TETTS|nr:3-methyladenine DNA glycosylase [Tetrahymena thermophila SB210]EAS05440.1 3-methyladenine DNA glycosylase [Tetrahymena thermophila SB210]|eukprot:XP_001025685.1 3-methyladenine DNA glycosylase [Tetrahymena thermophila SB210]
MPPKKTRAQNGKVQKRPVEEDLDEIEEEVKMESEDQNKKNQKENTTNGKPQTDDQDILKKLGDDDPIPKEFYNCCVVDLAQKLIGTYLIRVLDDGTVLKAMIVETEAYKAPLDKACHAYNNKKTEKTKWFWQDGGHLYMYSIYGNNNCMNIVSATKDEPEAVLIRALEPIQGIQVMKKFRGSNPKLKDKDLTNGPGKLTQAINIDKDYNGHTLFEKGKLYLVKGLDKSAVQIEASKRINIDYAQEWVDKLWRFTLKGNKFVSK